MMLWQLDKALVSFIDLIKKQIPFLFLIASSPIMDDINDLLRGDTEVFHSTESNDMANCTILFS
jgi:hypothetical protein